MPYQVSRQIRWPDSEHQVELTRGSLDSISPDCLKIVGSYDDPREAAQAAVDEAQTWQRQEPEEEITLGFGSTMDAMLSLEGEPIKEESTAANALAWGEKEYEALAKCECCGGILGKNTFWHQYFGQDTKFCSENCAENAAEQDEKRRREECPELYAEDGDSDD